MKKYQIIYKDLEKAIHEQKYQVGDFLPTEQELVFLIADRFGVLFVKESLIAVPLL